MPKGGHPLPQNVRRLHGETRPSRTRVEPQPAERVPDPPAGLEGEAREIWDYTVSELDAMNILYAADRDALAMYCSSVAVFREADRAIAAEGRIYTDSNGQMRRSPWVMARSDAINTATRLAISFGLTPVARAHMAKPAKEAEQPDELLG